MKTLKGSNQGITTCHKSLQYWKTYKNILEFTDWNLFCNEEEFLFKMLPSNLELKLFLLELYNLIIKRQTNYKWTKDLNTHFSKRKV